MLPFVTPVHTSATALELCEETITQPWGVSAAFKLWSEDMLVRALRLLSPRGFRAQTRFALHTTLTYQWPRGQICPVLYFTVINCHYGEWFWLLGKLKKGVLLRINKIITTLFVLKALSVYLIVYSQYCIRRGALTLLEQMAWAPVGFA